jgi:hypothetical protein
MAKTQSIIMIERDKLHSIQPKLLAEHNDSLQAGPMRKLTVLQLFCTMTDGSDNQDIHGLPWISLTNIYIISLQPINGYLLIISKVPPSFWDLFSLRCTSGASDAYRN